MRRTNKNVIKRGTLQANTQIDRLCNYLQLTLIEKEGTAIRIIYIDARWRLNSAYIPTAK